MRNRLLIITAMATALMAADEPPSLQAVRQYALNYVRQLPDYTCVQDTKRASSRQPSRLGTGQGSTDQIEEELSFVGGTEHYKVTKVNGFPTANASPEQLSGAVSQGEFGSLLRKIFDPATGTTFRAAPPAKFQGRTMHVLTFSVPQAKGYLVDDGEQHRQLLLAFEGSVYADAETNAVMRFTMKCINIPSDAMLVGTELTLEYKPTDLSGREFILPSHFQLSWRRRMANAPTVFEDGTNSVDFKSYRRFTAESNIDFSK